jgi:hypothetical protein
MMGWTDGSSAVLRLELVYSFDGKQGCISINDRRY